MLNQFQAYLVQRGYKEYSINGNPSTAIDYTWRISKICEREGITEQALADRINEYLQIYSPKGDKWILSKRSHQSYWNALRNYRKFVLISRFGPIAQ